MPSTLTASPTRYEEGPPLRAALDRFARSRIRDDAAACAAVESVAPQRLHRVVVRAEGDVLRGALARRDPGALVRVLLAAAVQPAAVGERVGGRLGVLMAGDDGISVEVTVAEGVVGAVDEVHAT